MLLSVIARVLSAAVSIYMLLCTIRVFMSWAPGFRAGKAGEILRAVVDPFFGLFSRIEFLRGGKFDFSPIAALAVLSVLNNLLTTLAYTGKISIGFVLGLAVGAVWSAVGFVLSFLTACALVRILVLVLRLNSLHPVWVIVDSILNPVLYRVNRIVYRGRVVNYLQGLITGFIVLLVLRAGGGALAGLVVRLLESLPF